MGRSRRDHLHAHAAVEQSFGTRRLSFLTETITAGLQAVVHAPPASSSGAGCGAALPLARKLCLEQRPNRPDQGGFRLSFLAGPDRGCVNTTARLWVGSPRVSAATMIWVSTIRSTNTQIGRSLKISEAEAQEGAARYTIGRPIPRTTSSCDSAVIERTRRRA